MSDQRKHSVEAANRLLLRHYAESVRQQRQILRFQSELIQFMENSLGVESSPFVPNAFQKAILAALDKKGLRTDALAAKVGDRRRLFKDPGGLPELMDEGMVAHHKRIGYYRTDSPPQDLTQSQGE